MLQVIDGGGHRRMIWPMTEIELKFLLDEAAEQRLRRLAELRSMTRGRAETRELSTVYYDTPEGHLRRRKLALRLRRKGAKHILTVKVGRAMRAGLSRVREVETEVPDGAISLDAIPDPGVRDEIIAALGGVPFGPVVETSIRRTTRMLDHGGSWIEFALDAGEVVAGDRRAELRECELELVEGEPQHLFDAAAAIFSDGLIRFSERTKVERGWLLAEEGRIADPVEVRKARKVRYEPKASTEAVAGLLTAECLDQVAANALVIRDRDDPEGPHQFRVGLRRLRIVMWCLPKEHHPPRVSFLLDEARRLAATAGAVRDLDVLRIEVLGPVRETGSDLALDTLDAALAARAEAARAALRAVLDEGRTQRFLLELAAAAALGARRPRAGELGAEALGQPVASTMADALDRTWRRVRKRARGIAGLDHEARHELRKALKSLRYTVEFARPLYGAERTRPFLAQLKALQDVFGSLNDLAMAEVVLLADDAPCRDDADVQRAVGLMVGAARVRAEHDWEGAKAAWKRLKKQDRFWE